MAEGGPEVDTFPRFFRESLGHGARTRSNHDSWPIQPAEAVIAANDMTAQIDVTLPDAPPLCHFAERLDVVAWTLEPA